VRALARLSTLLLLAVGGAFAHAAPAAPQAAAASSPAAPVALPRIVVGFANMPHSMPSPAGGTSSRYAGDGYRLSQSAKQQAQRIAAQYALREVASWPIEALSMHCVVYEITNGRPMSEVLAALSRDSRVMLAQPLQEFHTLGTPAAAAPAPYNDPLYDLQTNLVTLGIARAHQHAEGAGVRIALIDTGVDTTHPDLEGRIASAQSFIPREHRTPAELRHGTAMAGVIAAVANNGIGIVGIAPLARLEVFEACWQLAPGSDAAACNTFTLARALAAALAAGTPLVNLSLAGPADPLLAALVQTGLKRGVTFVAASAAEGDFPGSIPGVISAAGSEGPVPAGALVAPGSHVLTLRPEAQYDFESGSSVAAAEVTGVIALLMSAAHERLTPESIVALLSAPEPGTLTASATHASATHASAAPSSTARADGAVARTVDVNAALDRLEQRATGVTLLTH
jgi:subtilisin family serine protease